MGRKQSRRRKYVYFCLAGLIFVALSGCAAPEKIKVEIKPHGEVDHHLLRGRELFAQKDFEGALIEYQEIFPLATHQPPEDEALYMIGLIYAHPENPKRNSMKSLYYFNRVTAGYPRSLWAGQTTAWIRMLQENGKFNLSIDDLNRRVKQLQLEKSKLLEEREARVEERKARQPLLNSRELLLQGKYEEASKEIQKFLALSPRHPLEDEALFQMGLIYAHPGNSKKDYGKSISTLKKLMKDYPQSPWSDAAKIWTGMMQENERLNQAVEKLSQTIEKSKQVDIEIEEKKREKGK
jgi:outer membrane protein assembly factor BamD (BamD/ComL family)